MRRFLFLWALVSTCCVPQHSHGVQTLSVRIAELSSSEVRLEWHLPDTTSSVRVTMGAEPSPRRDGPLPDGVRLATVGPDESGLRITGLAPGAPTFLRVEAETARGSQAANLFARTAGGPRARLDGPVREIHAVGPRVLMVVVANGDATAWQHGPWTVTRHDGSILGVARVHRHSIPVGQPDYPIGFGAEGGSDRVDVDHRIYLMLRAPIGSRDVLRIRGPQGVDLRFPFSDRYSETPVIQLNQVGYNPRAHRRWAYVSAYLGDGGGMRLDDFPREAEVVVDPGQWRSSRTVAVAGLPIAARAALDADAGAPVRQIDLATVPPAEDRIYRVRIPGVGVSWPTQVSEGAALKAFYVVTRGLFLNRWAGDLRRRYTDWERPSDHGRVFTGESTHIVEPNPRETPRTGARRLRGGYHDAGDFDQRPMHTVVPQLLMRAFELHPGTFRDGQLTIPESGNGVPDLLDEALWGIEAWIELQEADGGVRAGVESWREPWGYYSASDDPLPYWTFARDANTTARAAGLFAQAARLLAPFDRARAADLRNRAVRAWTYAREHGAAPAFRLFALGELYRLTTEPAYKAEFEAVWPTLGPDGPFSRLALAHNFLSDYVSDFRVMPDYLLGYLGSETAAPELRREALRWLDQYANAVVAELLGEHHAHRTPRGDRPAAWGQAAMTARYLDPVLARMQIGGLTAEKRQEYLDALSLSADYVLGGNPLGMVFLTGLGSRSPQEPLHLDSLVFLARGRPPMPGIPVYGPVEELPAADYYRPGEHAFYPAFSSLPLMQRYGDLRSFVTTNEFSVWDCQAPLSELFAVLLGPGMSPPRSWLPGRQDHQSPYPGSGSY